MSVLLANLCSSDADYQKVIATYSQRQTEAASNSLSKDEDTELKKLKCRLMQVRIATHDHSLSKQQLCESLQARETELLRDTAFVECLEELHLLNEELTRQDATYKEISLLPTKAAWSRLFGECWDTLSLAAFVVHKLDQGLPAEAASARDAINGWLHQKWELFFTRLTYAQFYSRDVFVHRTGPTAADRASFELDLSEFCRFRFTETTVRLFGGSLPKRLKQFLLKCIQHRCLKLVEKYGHLTSLALRQDQASSEPEVLQVVFDFESAKHFDAKVIATMCAVPQVLATLRCLEGCQMNAELSIVGVEVVDKYLSHVADSAQLDKSVYVLQHRQQLENLIAFRNELVDRCCQDQERSELTSRTIKVIRFEDVFRELGASQPGKSTNDAATDTSAKIWSAFDAFFEKKLTHNELYKELDGILNQIEKNSLVSGSFSEVSVLISSVVKAIVVIFRSNKTKLYDNPTLDDAHFTKVLSMLNRVEAFLQQVLDCAREWPEEFVEDITQSLSYCSLVCIRCWEFMKG